MNWLRVFFVGGLTSYRALFRFLTLPTRFWSAPVRQLRRELGLPPGTDPIFAGRHSPHLVLALFSRVIGEPQPDWPANAHATGFPFLSHSDGNTPELQEFLDSGELPIVFTLGSAAVGAAGDFYVDPSRAVERAVITHAHSDHARRGSKSYLATADGAALLRQRIGEHARIKTVRLKPNRHVKVVGAAGAGYEPE